MSGPWMVGCARQSSLTDLGYSWSLTPNSGCWPSMPLLPSDLQPEPDSERKTPPRQHDTLRWMLMLEIQAILVLALWAKKTLLLVLAFIDSSSRLLVVLAGAGLMCAASNGRCHLRYSTTMAIYLATIKAEFGKDSSLQLFSLGLQTYFNTIEYCSFTDNVASTAPSLALGTPSSVFQPQHHTKSISNLNKCWCLQ